MKYLLLFVLSLAAFQAVQEPVKEISFCSNCDDK